MPEHVILWGDTDRGLLIYLRGVNMDGELLWELARQMQPEPLPDGPPPS